MLSITMLVVRTQQQIAQL